MFSPQFFDERASRVTFAIPKAKIESQGATCWAICIECIKGILIPAKYMQQEEWDLSLGLNLTFYDNKNGYFFGNTYHTREVPIEKGYDTYELNVSAIIFFFLTQNRSKILYRYR